MSTRILDRYVEVNDIHTSHSWKDLIDPYELLYHAVKLEAEGKYGDTKSISDLILKKSPLDNISMFGARVMQLYAGIRIETTDDLREDIASIDKLEQQVAVTIQNLDSTERYNFLFFTAIYNTAKSTYTFYQGKYQEALEFNFLAIKAWDEIEEQEGKYLVSVDIQFCYTRLGDFKSALHSSDELLQDMDKDKSKLTYCHALLARSEIFKLLSNYQEAADILEMACQISVELGIDELRYHSIRFLADVYSKQGLYDKAWKLQHQALEYFSKSGNPNFQSLILNDIGDTARMKQDYDLAENFYEKSIEQSEEIDNFDMIVDSYYKLILLGLTRNQPISELNGYLEEITKFAPKGQDPKYTILPQLAEAIVATTNERLDLKFGALISLREILHQPGVYDEYRLTCVYYMTELLLYEYSLTRKQAVFDEIKKVLSFLYVIGSSMHSTQVLIDYYLLMIRFHKELADEEQILFYLSKARTLAERSETPELIAMIDLEDNLIKQDLRIIPMIQSGDYDEIDNIQTMSNYLDELKKGRVPKIKKNFVEPQIVMIISEGGSNLFSKDFDNSIKAEHSLIAAFLNAMTSFSQEAFTDTSKIELIKLGDQKLIIHSLDDFLLAYVFTGYSPKAIDQLQEFGKLLFENQPIYINFKHSVLSNQDRITVTQLAEQVFVN